MNFVVLQHVLLNKALNVNSVNYTQIYTWHNVEW